MDEDQFLQSIIANPELTDPSLDVSEIRTTTPTRQEVLADVPEFSGLQFDPTQQSYFEDLYALYSGAIPTIEPPVVATPTVDTTPVIDIGDMDQATSDSILDTTPTITTPTVTTPTITQPAGGGADMATVPATGDDSITIENIAQNQTPYDVPMDLSDPGASIENIIAKQDLSVKPRPQIASQLATKGPTTIEGGLIPGDIPGVNPVDEVALTGAQTDSLNALAKASNSIADFGRKVQDTLGGVFDSVNNTIDVFGQKFNVAKTATGLALNAAFKAPVSLAFGLVDQISESLPQSSQVVADVLTQTYGVDDQGRVKGNPATNVFAGMNAVSMFGNPIQAAKERIDNVVDPAKKDLFQKQLDSVQFKVENQISAPQENIGATSIKDTADVEADLPTSTIDTFRGPTIAEVTDGPVSDDDPTDVSPSVAEEMSEVSLEAPGDDGPGDASTSDAQAAANREAAREGQYEGRDSGPAATADAGFEDSGPSNVGGPPSGPGESSADGPNGCFLADTLITMADGSTKEVQKVDLGDKVAEGGKVFATGKFLIKNLYDYKGIKVSGSHMVNEDGNWTRVEDSKHGKPLGDDEHTVYVFGAENRRILINDILFTDYFEVTDQEKLLKYEDKFFDNWKIYANKEDINNVNTLNAS